MLALTVLLGTLLLVAPALPVPQPLEAQLPSGLSVIVVPQPRHPVVTVQTWLLAGSVDEEPTQAGTARLLMQVLGAGGKRYGRDGVDAAVQAVGGRNMRRVGPETAVFSTTVPAVKLELALQIAADRLRAPQLDKDRIARAAAELSAQDQARGVDGPERALAVLQTLSFLTHPLRQPLDGWWYQDLPDPVRSCRSFFDAHVAPARTALIVVGDVDPPRTLGLIKKVLASWTQRKAGPRRNVAELPVSGARRLEMIDTAAPGWLAVGWRTPGLTQVDALALEVLVEALADSQGQLRGAVASPLTTNARLRYRPHAPHGLLELWCPLELNQDPAALEAALRATVEQKLRAVDDSTLQAATARVRSAWLRQRDSAEDLALATGENSLLRGAALSSVLDTATLDGLTPAILRQVSERCLRPSQASVVVVFAGGGSTTRSGDGGAR
ncbi:MAG: pitrilysin family protein [Pseudomonadota bacterium]